MLVLIAILAINLLTSDKQVSACVNFITAIQKGDAEKSYNLLSDEARTSKKLKDWQKEVPILRTAYGEETVPKLVSDPQKTSLLATDPSIQEAYELTNSGTTYKVTCYFDRPDTAYVFSGFTSQIKGWDY